MTEQPVETEQQFLGNEGPNACANCSGPIRQTVGLVCPDCGRDFSSEPAEAVLAVVRGPLQHYSPGAHLRRPSWSPVDDVELASLARKSAHANRLLAIARAESARAEEALQLALGVEDEAAIKVREADEALIAFTRKGTGL